MKALFISSLFAIGIYASDIFELVGYIDKNDTSSFVTAIKTVEDANTHRSDNNKTILMYSAWMGNEEAVNHLLEKGADINMQDETGATALHLAIWKNHESIALKLLEKGADFNLLSKDGMSAMDIAILKGNQNILKVLDSKTPKRKTLGL